MCKRLNIVVLVTALLACGSSGWAQNRCRVLDPTGTPLNVRTAPNGVTIGTIANGVLVTVIDRTFDAAGKPWVYVAGFDNGRPIGWIFREFIACF